MAVGPKVHVSNASQHSVSVAVLPDRGVDIGEVTKTSGAGDLTCAYFGRSSVEAFLQLNRLRRFLGVESAVAGAMAGLVASPVAIRIAPGQTVAVVEKVQEEFKPLLDPDFYRNLLGAKTLTLMIAEGERQRLVLFETNDNHSWIVDESGVRRSQMGSLWEPSGDLHRWNAGRYNIGFDASAAPSLALHRGQMHCFYRDGRGDGNGILHIVCDKANWKQAGKWWTGIDSDKAPCFIPYRDDLGLLVYQPRHTQTLHCAATSNGLEFGNHTPIGFASTGRVTGAVLGGTACVAGTTAVSPLKLDQAAPIFVSVFDGRKWEARDTGVKTTGSPAVVANRGAFHLFHPIHGIVHHSVSSDGRSWKAVSPVSTEFGTSSGVAVVEWNGNFLMFYRDKRGNGVFVAESGDGYSFRPMDESYLDFDARDDLSAVVAGGSIHLMSLDPDGRALMWAVPPYM